MAEPLTQEALVNFVAKAIEALEVDGHVYTTNETQVYLQVEFGIREKLARIKECTDIIAELQDEVEE
jgi:hypothetical protein